MYYRRFGKRALDILLSVFGLALFSPVMVAVATAIRVDDRGCAVFRQHRIGRNGQPFVIFKFRSMPLDTPEVESAKATTLRLTRVGRVIRRSSLDELPQLLNVVRGDMSLVGPRPPIASQEELIELRRRNGSISLRPGVTGLAQLRGYDGMSNCEKAQLDGEYSRSLSLRTDARILLRTVQYLSRRPPEY